MTDDKTAQPDLENWLITEAISASDSGDYDQSYLYYERAFSIAPTSALLAYNWAITALRRRDRNQIAACASRLAAFAPEDWRTSMAQAYLMEVEGEAEKGWQLCQQAYEKVGNIEKLDEVGFITADVLLFAYRNEIKTGLQEIVGQVYEVGVFSENVLGALRKLDGKLSRHAFDYLVLIEGDFSNTAFPDSKSYVRSYRVLAEGAEEAGQTAVDFESRCGGVGLKISSVEKKGQEETEVELGVWWRLQAQVIAGTDSPA